MTQPESRIEHSATELSDSIPSDKRLVNGHAQNELVSGGESTRTSVIKRKFGALIIAGSLALGVGSAEASKGNENPGMQQGAISHENGPEAAPVPEGFLSRKASDKTNLNVPSLRLYDLGVNDFNGDGNLDVDTSNHSYPLALLENKGNGTFAEVSNSTGFNLDPQFPGFEYVDQVPTLSQNGLYLYMSRASKDDKTTYLNIVANGEPASGIIDLTPSRKIKYLDEPRPESVDVDYKEIARTLSFDLESGERVITKFTLQLPVKVHTQNKTFVGAYSIEAPNDFSLGLPDRHGVAFADLNGDGAEDAYEVVGGLGGGISISRFKDASKDKTMIYSDGIFQETDLGLRKGNCRGRQTAAVDANGDGAIDLFQSCEEASPIIDFQNDGAWQRKVIPTQGETYRWIQSGKSTKPKLLALGERAALLALGKNGWKQLDTNVLRGEADQTTLADFDNNGSPDVFVSSPRGNTLLSISGDNIIANRPKDLGLPTRGTAASWIDIDNDGRYDLHTIPDGLYRQQPNGKFDETGLYKVNTKYGHDIWADFNNDGIRDPLIGLSNNEFPLYGRAVLLGRSALQTSKKNGWLEIDLPGGLLTSKVVVNPGGPKGKNTIAWAGQSETSRNSQGHNRVYVPIPRSTNTAGVTVTTPSGKKYKVNTAVNQVIRIP